MSIKAPAGHIVIVTWQGLAASLSHGPVRLHRCHVGYVASLLSPCGLCSLVVVAMWNLDIAIVCVDVLSLVTTAQGLCRIAVVVWGLCGHVIIV